MAIRVWSGMQYAFLCYDEVGKTRKGQIDPVVEDDRGGDGAMIDQVELRASVPAYLKQALDQIAQQSAASGHPITVDSLVASALMSYVTLILTDTAPARTPGYTLPATLQHIMVENETAQTRARAELQARREETPEQAVAAAEELRALFAAWNAEVDQMDPAQVEADWEEFQASMNANRAAAGERLLYP